ncbi:hypothetical protein FB45DRAFT_1001241 [Roridomyces roridus]|uniref:Ras-GAP domain-containing protein n=1 Tax=Roridomyces roridus TaxID=1738132 RepID=A0AAD7C5D1_9AGAR|nr:hypothetical protein FB45DRAFT_1001241 [Roridomyces roridus]
MYAQRLLGCCTTLLGEPAFVALLLLSEELQGCATKGPCPCCDNSETSLFRSNSTCTRFLSAFAKVHGYAYLRSLIIPLIRRHGVRNTPTRLARSSSVSPPTPDLPLTNRDSLYDATVTIDDLTQALDNVSRVPSPEPLSALCCCCGLDDCENLQAWLAVKARLESRLTLSAEVGQALLQRHEAYVRRHEATCHLPRAARSLEEETESNEAALAAKQDQLDELTKENKPLEKRLTQALVNNEVTEVSHKTILQESAYADKAYRTLTSAGRSGTTKGRGSASYDTGIDRWVKVRFSSVRGYLPVVVVERGAHVVVVNQMPSVGDDDELVVPSRQQCIRGSEFSRFESFDGRGGKRIPAALYLIWSQQIEDAAEQRIFSRVCKISSISTQEGNLENWTRCQARWRDIGNWLWGVVGALGGLLSAGTNRSPKSALFGFSGSKIAQLINQDPEIWLIGAVGKLLAQAVYTDHAKINIRQPPTMHVCMSCLSYTLAGFSHFARPYFKIKATKEPWPNGGGSSSTLIGCEVVTVTLPVSLGQSLGLEELPYTCLRPLIKDYWQAMGTFAMLVVTTSLTKCFTTNPLETGFLGPELLNRHQAIIQSNFQLHLKH